jgi:hypothetical protein
VKYLSFAEIEADLSQKISVPDDRVITKRERWTRELPRSLNIQKRKGPSQPISKVDLLFEEILVRESEACH